MESKLGARLRKVSLCRIDLQQAVLCQRHACTAHRLVFLVQVNAIPTPRVRYEHVKRIGSALKEHDDNRLVLAPLGRDAFNACAPRAPGLYIVGRRRMKLGAHHKEHDRSAHRNDLLGLCVSSAADPLGRNRGVIGLLHGSRDDRAVSASHAARRQQCAQLVDDFAEITPARRWGPIEYAIRSVHHISNPDLILPDIAVRTLGHGNAIRKAILARGQTVLGEAADSVQKSHYEGRGQQLCLRGHKLSVVDHARGGVLCEEEIEHGRTALKLLPNVGLNIR